MMANRPAGEQGRAKNHDCGRRRIDREVWIITAASGGRRGGLTATLDFVGRRSILLGRCCWSAWRPITSLATGAERRVFARCTCWRPVRSNWPIGSLKNPRVQCRIRWLGFGRLKASRVRLEVFAGFAAWLHCRIFKQYDAGDRWFFWADCLAGEDSGRPVLREKAFFAGLIRRAAAAVAAQPRLREPPLHRPLHEAWRQEK